VHPDVVIGVYVDNNVGSMLHNNAKKPKADDQSHFIQAAICCYDPPTIVQGRFW
jgi:hypothetical protein